MIAALFVDPKGVYSGLPDVEVWDEKRDARKYAGPWPVVAHPPCERWGRYWHGGPSVTVRKTKGDDGGCFKAALEAVRKFGGVLEHPAHSHAWNAFQLIRPQAIGWSSDLFHGGWVCEVSQAAYGHRAAKLTWLFATRPANLTDWQRPKGQMKLDDGFHSAEERRLAKAKGWVHKPRLPTKERSATPVAFRDLLLDIARSCVQSAC